MKWAQSFLIGGSEFFYGLLTGSLLTGPRHVCSCLGGFEDLPRKLEKSRDYTGRDVCKSRLLKLNAILSRASGL